MAKPLQILIIDGDPAHVRILEHLLSGSGGIFQTFATDSISKAQDIYHEKSIDICLLDLHLDGEKEYLTLGKFKQNFLNLPVIVIAARNNEVLFQQSIKNGAYNFLVKGEIEERELKRSIQIAVQLSAEHFRDKNTSLKLNRLQNLCDIASSISGLGYFTMDLVTNEMYWSDVIYDLFKLKRGSLAQPGLSAYLDFVHPADREQVNQLFINSAENHQIHRFYHRLLVDGHQVRIVNTTLKAARAGKKGKLEITGTLQDLNSIKIPTGRLSLALNILSNFTLSIDSLLVHHGQILKLYREAALYLQNDEVSPLFENIMIEHEVMTELVYKAVKENLSLFAEQELPEASLDFQKLLEHLKNYYWMRTGNQQIKTSIDFIPTRIREIKGNYLLLTVLFAAWAELSLLGLQSAPQKSKSLEFRGEVFEEKNQSAILQLSISGIPINAPAKYDLDEIPPDSKNLINLQVLKFVSQKGLCHFNSTKEKNGTRTEILNIRIHPLTGSNKPAKFDHKNPLRILLAEDHLLNQVNYRKLIEQLIDHVTLDIVSNGREALENVKSSASYDLILLDLNMPVMGGVEAARLINSYSDAPIAGLASLPSHQLIQAARDAGITEFLEKPLKKRALKMLIHKMTT
ncbi:MAG: response regulator [Bacteroidetes bacterium]|nr:response regulator [Bacteroidota bacterium]